jgi:hypothetical protein
LLDRDSKSLDFNTNFFFGKIKIPSFKVGLSIIHEPNPKNGLLF